MSEADVAAAVNAGALPAQPAVAYGLEPETTVRMPTFRVLPGRDACDAQDAQLPPDTQPQDEWDARTELAGRTSHIRLNEMQAIDTAAMMNQLKGDEFPDRDSFVGRGFLEEDVRLFFNELFEDGGLSRSDVIRDAHISRAYGYQLLNGNRVGKRDYYLSIAVAMRLDLRTTQRLLAVTCCGSLHALLRRDAAVIFAINHGYDNIQLYEFLTELGLKPLETRTD